jgi:hypothetical protein
MTEATLPESAPLWLWVLFIVTPVLVALITYWGGRKNRADIKEVREHVANTHQTNLREDIDKIISGMTDIKSVQFDQGQTLDRMNTRIHDVDRKVEVYRDVVEKFLIQNSDG